MDEQTKRRWPRVSLTLPPDIGLKLDEIAAANYRDRRSEAMRLLVDAVRRERPQTAEAPR